MLGYGARLQSWQSKILSISLCLMLIMALVNFGCASQGQVPTSGNLRLVITGVTDQGQPFVAYKDVEIID